MAGGKLTPRQKMINMMYLVLTALLAMNVSAEILNAFKTVNNSIVNSNGIIMDKNADTYSKFQDAIADPQTADKAKKWVVYAESARIISDAIYNKLEDIKLKLKTESGLEIVDGEEEYKLDELNAASRILIEEGQGSEIYDEVSEYRKELLNILNPSNFEGEPVTKELITQKLAEFDKSFAINLTVPKSTTGAAYTQDGKGWSESNFHMTPTVAAVTILSKLQNDIRSSQAQMVDFCFGQIGQVKVVYDAFEVIASANTNYAMPGDEIEIVAGIGAFSEAAQPVITIAGAVVPLSGGQAIYKTTASGSGERAIPVKITYTTPAGESKTVDKVIKYTVGTPSGAAVQFDKMNVMYIGVDNPITVKSSTGDEQTTVTLSSGSLSKVGPGRYSCKVTNPSDNATININAGGVMNKFPFRIKYIPDPIPTLGGDEVLTTNGKGQKGTIKAKGGIVPLLKNFDFEARYNVISYDFYLTSGGELLPARDNAGPMYSGAVLNLLDRAKPKDLIVFDNIKVQGPDGKTRKIPGMSFQIF